MSSASPTLLNNRDNIVRGFVVYFLKNWDKFDFFFYVAALDEFFIYSVRKSNSKNHTIFAANLDISNNELHYRQVEKFLECSKSVLLKKRKCCEK